MRWQRRNDQSHVSECSKSTQKEYKKRQDCVGKFIHWEMCKKFKFDYTNKWYMHNPAPVLENDTHKLQWDVDIQTDHLISAWRSDLTLINKIKSECEKKDKYLDLAKELKKKTNYGARNCTSCDWCCWYGN